jgi:hypothetical protein
MPQSLLTGQLKEKPTFMVWCLYSSFVHERNTLALKLPLPPKFHQLTFTHKKSNHLGVFFSANVAKF